MHYERKKKEKKKFFVAAWATEAQNKNMINIMSQEGYFVNGRGLVMYFKMFKIFLSMR